MLYVMSVHNVKRTLMGELTILTVNIGQHYLTDKSA